jgi:hypothetical protein
VLIVELLDRRDRGGPEPRQYDRCPESQGPAATARCAAGARRRP